MGWPCLYPAVCESAVGAVPGRESFNGRTVPCRNAAALRDSTDGNDCIQVPSVSADRDDAVPAMEQYSQGRDGKQTASDLQENSDFTAGTAGNLCGCQHELCSLHLRDILII